MEKESNVIVVDKDAGTAFDLEDFREYSIYKRAKGAILSLNMMQFLDDDRLDGFRKVLDGMTADEMDELLLDIREITGIGSEDDFPLLKFYSMVKQSLLEQRKNPIKVCGISGMLADKDDASKVLACSSDSYASDRFCMTEDVLSGLRRIWHGDNSSSMDAFVPSDLLFANKLPLNDMEISIEKEVDGRKVVYESRVHVHGDYGEHLEDDEYANRVMWLGCLDIHIPTLENAGIGFVFGIIRGLDVLVMEDRGCPYGVDEDFISIYREESYVSDVVQLCTKHLQAWYTVQMSLLNPLLSDLMGSGRVMKDKRKRLLGFKMVQMNRKFRQHVITSEDVDRVYADNPFLSEDSTSRRRLGHWRTKDGKTTFVPPYWKGKIRDFESKEV